MLTRDLLRYKCIDGKLLPTFLKDSPANLELSERLIRYWQNGIGQCRGDLDDGALPLLHQSRAVLVARGLQKIIVDACTFEAPLSCSTLRAEALTHSARLLTKPSLTSDAHRAAIGQLLNIPSDDLQKQLYADLPDAEVLQIVPPLTARQLINHYNMALCQSLILHAKELHVTIHDANITLRRQLIKNLRFRRLLAEIIPDPQALRLVISGPDALFDQASRYGLQLALFLPALCCATSWTARAKVRIQQRGAPDAHAILDISQATGLGGDARCLAYVPKELQELGTQLTQRAPQWTIEDGPLLPLSSGDIIVPDMRVSTPTGSVDIELFHRWHDVALKRRLDQCAQGTMPSLALGVDRHIATRPAIAELLASDSFIRQGFLFSSIPTSRAIVEIVERILNKKQ